jgi:CRISPR system Cascade subunit CasE
MHLSRLLLDRRSRQVQADLAQPYELHRTLARAFPTPDGVDYRQHHGVLYRVEEHPAPAVLVQSVGAPDWSGLPEGYAARVDGPKPFAPRLFAGQQLRFRLHANPTMQRLCADGVRRRIGLFREVAADGAPSYYDWLERRAQRGGFEVVDVAGEPFRLRARRGGGEGASGKALPLRGVRFDGVLRVSDVDSFEAALRQGVGKSKALGFGLLSVAP